jgi:hypothetical protein
MNTQVDPVSCPPSHANVLVTLSSAQGCPEDNPQAASTSAASQTQVLWQHKGNAAEEELEAVHDKVAALRTELLTAHLALQEAQQTVKVREEELRGTDAKIGELCKKVDTHCKMISKLRAQTESQGSGAAWDMQQVDKEGEQANTDVVHAPAVGEPAGGDAGEVVEAAIQAAVADPNQTADALMSLVIQAGGYFRKDRSRPELSARTGLFAQHLVAACLVSIEKVPMVITTVLVMLLGELPEWLLTALVKSTRTYSFAMDSLTEELGDDEAKLRIVCGTSDHFGLGKLTLVLRALDDLRAS